MFGSSRGSLVALRASVDARRAEPGFDGLAGELLAVAAVLGREKSLRQALADAGQPVSVRTGIASSLFDSQISPLAASVLTDVVSSRWSHDADLVDAVEQLGAQVAFTTADADSSLDRVENELFTFGRAVDESPALQMALTDPSTTTESKAGLVNDLVGASASPVTVTVLTHLAGNLRGRRPASAVEELARLASQQRHQVLAEVRSAIALTDDQSVRLAGALTALQGRLVRLNNVVDPDVVGGIVVRVGDDVIDGSVASRLEQARRALSA
jgi:F-type H+-transporting ATPase subunit delta